MKRVISLSLIFVLLLSAIPLSFAADQTATYPVQGGQIHFDKSSGTVTRCDSTVTAADIPAAIEGVAVKAIGNFAFESCAQLQQVSIPAGVERIGRSAFAYCSELESISLPESLIFLDDLCFFDCQKLAKIHLGGAEWIGKNAFLHTAFYRNAKNWKKDVLISGHCLLAAKNTLSGSYTVPSQIKVLASGAFYGCTGLTAVTLPEGLVSLCDESLYYCISLEKIEIPDSVRIVGESAFRHCAELKEVRIGDGVGEIKEQAFAFCGELKTVYLGKELAKIGTKAFAECDELKAVYFFGDAPTLGENCFDISGTELFSYLPIPGLTLYYRPSAKGWQSPSWQGYPAESFLPAAEFSDVTADAWYAPAVNYAVEFGLMNGTGKNKFEPESPMTRAMLVTVLWRYEGEPIEGKNSFEDVKKGAWYEKAVSWAFYNGIVSGVGNGRFDPDGKITREQLAAILYRYCSAKGLDTLARAELSAFPDGAKVSGYAVDALSWAVAVGLVNGSDGKLLPQGNATRAQVATILMRFMETVVK